MEKNILEILLSSGVIANLVTSIFNLTQGFHKDKIDNVIKERKSWREKIREIALNLENAYNYSQIKNLLVELKVLLNAYGIKGGSDYNQDVHIWQVIKKIEDDTGSFEKNKELLIKYLSLLLKYDW